MDVFHHHTNVKNLDKEGKGSCMLSLIVTSVNFILLMSQLN